MAGRDDAARRTEAYVQRIEADRRAALGPLRRGNGRIASERERTALLAADNLIAKAYRRIEQGDPDTALQLVERALTLRIDETDDGEDGALAAQLFVRQRLRGLAADADAEAWLMVAEAVTGETAGPIRTEWLSALARVSRGLGGAAAARIDALVEAEPDDVLRLEPLELVADPQLRVATVTGLLATLLVVELGVRAASPQG